MKYSVLLTLLSELSKLPGALYCYFVHSWTEWVECPSHKWGDYGYDCTLCGRPWQYVRSERGHQER